MQHTFTGIVLDQIPYSDSSVIVKFLSHESGLQSVVVKGLKGKRGRSLRPLLNKMNILEVEAYQGRSGALGILKHARVLTSTTAALGVRQNSIALFVNEVLCRVVRDGEDDPEQYVLVERLLRALGESDWIADLHLIFLMKFTKTFGALPDLRELTQQYFDLQEGLPCGSRPQHGHFLEGAELTQFKRCLGTDLAINADLGITNNERWSLLEKILEYYQLQLDEKLDLRSHKVLHTVLEES